MNRFVLQRQITGPLDMRQS